MATTKGGIIKNKFDWKYKRLSNREDKRNDH